MQLDVGDCQLHVEIDGPDDAPAVLLRNGARCTLRQWDLVVPRLMDRYRLLRFDVRGIGDHDPNLEYSREIVERVPGARLVVMENVGHGSVLQRPDLTTKIFLVRRGPAA